MSYSEGIKYGTLNKWTIFVRDSENVPWDTLNTTEDKSEVNLYVIDLNEKAGYQRDAVTQHTVEA